MSITSATAAPSLLAALRGELDGLQRQLGTGLKAQTYGGLGADRVGSLDIRGRLSALEGYDSAIGDATLRLKMMDAAVTRLAAMRGETRQALLPGTALPGVDGRAQVRATAEARLREAVDLLNQDAAGRHLFAGRATDKAPVQSYDRIMDGDPAAGRDGLKTLIAERKAADRGAGTGRLTLSTPSATGVALSESADPGTRLNFGFLVRGASATGSGAIAATSTAASPPTVTLAFPTQPVDGETVRVTVNAPDGSQSVRDLVARQGPAGEGEFAIGATPAATAANLNAALGAVAVAGAFSVTPAGAPGALTATVTAAGTPAAIGFDVTALPAEGDTVRVTLGLRDGTATTLTLTARTNPGAEPGAFAIGATPADTAANLRTALAAALGREADGALAAASARLASADFFGGGPTPPDDAPRRIAGDPATATGFAAPGAGRKTLIWYGGDDAPSARATASVRIDAGRSVGTGAQANEPAIRDLLASLGVLAAETFGTGGGEGYAALAARVSDDLAADGEAPSIEGIAAEFGLAQATLAGAKERHQASAALLEDALSGLERADPQETATAILALQTRLQASYEVTAMLSRLSLVNYL